MIHIRWKYIMMLGGLGCFFLQSVGCRSQRETVRTAIHHPVASGGDSVNLRSVADSLFMEAQTRQMTGDLKSAIALLEAFRKLQPGNATVSYQLSRLFGQLHHKVPFLEYAREAYRLDSLNKWFALSFANALALNDRPDSAAVIFHRLHVRFPYDDDYVLQEAALLSRAGKDQEGMQLLQRLEQKSGLSEELVYQKQLIYLKRHQVDSASAEIRKLIRQNPSEARYYGLLAQVYENDNRVDSAIAVYKTLLAREPGNPRALVALALYYKKQGSDSVYRRYMRMAFANPAYDIEDKVAFVYPYLKYVEIDPTKKEEALFLAKMVVESHPEDVRAYTLYGDMLYQSKEPDSALGIYRRALAMDDSRFELWQQVMLIFAAESKNDSLRRISEEVIRRFPTHTLGWYFNGMVNVLDHRYESGVSALHKALQTGVKSTEMESRIYASLGEAFHALQHYQASDSSFEHSLALKPDDDLTLNNYSYYLSERGTQLDKAARLSKAAMELDSDNFVYQDTYAWILYKMKRYREARVWMEKSLQHAEARESPGYLEHYGDILFRLKETDNAVKYWKLAKEKGADSPELDRKIEERKLREANRPGKRKKDFIVHNDKK